MGMAIVVLCSYRQSDTGVVVETQGAYSAVVCKNVLFWKKCNMAHGQIPIGVGVERRKYF